MNQELNTNSLKEGVQYLCKKDPLLKKIVKKRQGQINSTPTLETALLALPRGIVAKHSKN